MNKHHSVPVELFDTLIYSSKHIPANIIQKWEKSDKTEESQNSILAEYKEKWTVVVSDFCWLTKLSSSWKNMIEIMKILSLPKEIIHSYATWIGWVPIWVWFADNTLTFYPEYIDKQYILSQMISAQKEILKAGFEVWMSIHSWEFIHIDWSVFGKDAELVQETWENHTSWWEIIISQNFLGWLNIDKQLFKIRQDMDFWENFYTFNYSNFKETNYKWSPLYPLPFDREFYNLISSSSEEEYLEIIKNREKTSFILFIKIIHPYEYLILDELANYIFTDSIITEATKNNKTTKVKSNWIYAIFYGEKIEEIIETTNNIINSLEEYYDFSVWVAYWNFLIFDLEDWQKEIAWNPVNIGSKLAEDQWQLNMIYFDESCWNIEWEPYEFEISNIKLKWVSRPISN